VRGFLALCMNFQPEALIDVSSQVLPTLIFPTLLQAALL